MFKLFKKKHNYFISYAMTKGDKTGFGSLTLKSTEKFCTENKQEIEDYITKKVDVDKAVILFIQELRR